MYVQELSGAPRAISAKGVDLENAHAVSPDGHWVLARDADHHPIRVSLDGGAPRPVNGMGPLDHVAQFSADGRVIIYSFDSSTEHLWHVSRLDPETGAREPLRDIHVPDDLAHNALSQLFLSADGASYAYSGGLALNALYLVDGLH